MNNRINFWNILVQASLIAFTIIGTSSCSDNTTKAATKETAEEDNNAKFNPNNEKDAEFLVNAAEINLQEIQLGQLAQQNTAIKEVKEFAKMMEDGHSKSMHELIALANSKSMVIPTVPTDNIADTYQKLKSLKGAEFNKEYCDMMVSGHKDAIVLFKRASEESVDPDIKQWAVATLPELNIHLDLAIACQKMLGKK
jgi:putative membrane protein